ncbi:R3H domain-containing protein 1-like [Panicum miliaceum]|uniref:R3H domain-containing protein 1-like n=1 Tax=Panicum miliaceum TaxID=4540 RepID=A0A3L6TMQ8_PANMI|nr:R3H domain-containing protein 1-like [Panicum miliaceum]
MWALSGWIADISFLTWFIWQHSQKPCKVDVVQEDTSVKNSHLKDTTDLKPLRQSVVFPAASLKEREAAYRAARERIFSGDDAKGNDKSYVKCRQVPVVAQRMIAHALGQKVQNPTDTVASTEGRGKQLPNGPKVPAHSRNNFYPVAPDNGEENNVRIGKPSSASRNSYQTSSSQRCRTANSRAATAESLKKEQTGAARRMFAHALGLSAAQGSYGALPKPK